MPLTDSPKTESTQQCCILVDGGCDLSQRIRETPLVIAVLSAESTLEILVNHGWQRILPQSYWDYFAALLIDWKERAAREPGTLFRQICSLSGGPLISVLTDSHLGRNPVPAELVSTFRPL